MTGFRTTPMPNPDWAYFFDFDGTLVPIAKSPDRVRVDRGLRRVIEDLRQTTGGAVAVVSGRGIDDLDRWFPGLRLAAAGQHGVERRSASGRMSRHRFPARHLDDARKQLSEAAARHSGLLVEDKGSSLALHYRRAPRLGGYAHRLAGSLVAKLGPAYCLQSGKRVVEIRPAGMDKGTAILEFTRERPFRGRTPVFIGDDVTDEHGFVMVNRLGGHSVKVGRGRTAARWRLPDVASVRGWLQRGQPSPTPNR